MEELYVEGLATRGGPGLSVGDPRGRGAQGRPRPYA